MKIAHAGHAELQVKDLEASKRFFTDVVGLLVSDEDDKSVYLRAWQDFEHHSLVLTKGDESALAHLGGRVEDPETLDQFARPFEQIGIPCTWTKARTQPGHGRGLRVHTPTVWPIQLYCSI